MHFSNWALEQDNPFAWPISSYVRRYCILPQASCNPSRTYSPFQTKITRLRGIPSKSSPNQAIHLHHLLKSYPFIMASSSVV
ncbi:hypothetical protein L195_g057119, partial [Trifolium pratense]